jgi:competence protein ComEC
MKNKKSIVIISLIVVSILVFAAIIYQSGFTKAKSSYVKTTFLNVGKADCILINTDVGNIIVDSGTSDMYETISDYLDKNNIITLDAAIVSHFDKDHIGSMGKLISKYHIKTVYFPGYSDNVIPNSNEFSELMDAIDGEEISPTYEIAGDSFTVAGIDFTVCSPTKTYTDSNDASLVLKAIRGKFSMLLTGDATENAESDILSSGIDISCDILKVAHHGNDDSSSKAFLTAVSPKYAVISVGTDDDTIPSSKVIKRLDNLDTEVYITSINGNITITSDCNGTYQIETESR